MSSLLEDSDVVAVGGVTMVDVRLNRVARPRTEVAGQAAVTSARSAAAQTTMARHDRSPTADKPAAIACC